jgi:hypothetical protein
MRPGGRFHWSAAGLWVAVIFYAATEAQLHLPKWGLVVLAGVATVGLIAATGWWRRLLDGAGTRVRRVVQRQFEVGRREATLRSCEQIISSLTTLLDRPEDFERRRWFDLSRMTRERDVLARYRKTVRPPCLDTLSILPPALTPPARVSAIAAEPRSIRDLHSLLVWFVTAADRLRAETGGAIELPPADPSRSPS